MNPPGGKMQRLCRCGSKDTTPGLIPNRLTTVEAKDEISFCRKLVGMKEPSLLASISIKCFSWLVGSRGTTLASGVLECDVLLRSLMSLN